MIDFVPHSGSSLVILSGDSGQGFKFLPVFGKWVHQLLECGEDRQPVTRWRWKDETANSSSLWAGNVGSVSWRVGETRELKELRPAP